ncbi:MAG: sigma-E processing peptidase SpoIIGA [Oscillospiraceae bacterium]|nr:sigma-E processing peptidase SpoIIGA [Oscillospiraceae bacterium]
MYADILIAINLIITYLLLRASAAVCGCEYKIWRLLASAAIGGVYSMIIFVDNLHAAVSFLIKTAVLALMVFVAFGAKSIKAFIKCCAAFFLSNFVFAGTMMALSIAIMPDFSIYKNGIAYFDIDILTLTLGAVTCYLILTIIAKFIKSRTPQKSIFPIKIVYNGNSVEGKALFDSGNALYDCFSGKPVVIAEKDNIKSVFEKELSEMRNFRLIPFTTIKSGGALPAFMADRVEIMCSGKWLSADEIYIAVTEKKIVSGEYFALLGTPFFDYIDNKAKGGFAVK